MLRWLVLGFVIACGGREPAPKPASSNWHASSVDAASLLRVRIDPKATWNEAATTIIGDMCPDAVLLWGDLVVDESVRPRAVEISVGDEKVLSGFLVCRDYIEPFLKMQTANPRFKAGHGGSADLKWRDGQLFLRRRWSAADIALGQLAPPPSDVFQRGEALAAIVSIGDPSETKPEPAKLLAAIARAPSVFVFGMFPLR